MNKSDYIDRDLEIAPTDGHRDPLNPEPSIGSQYVIPVIDRE